MMVVGNFIHQEKQEGYKRGAWGQDACLEALVDAIQDPRLWSSFLLFKD